MTKRIDITGQKFGKLTIIKYSHTVKPRGTATYLCSCECGNTTLVGSGHLRSGHTQSCGCLQVDIIKERSNGNTWGRKYKEAWSASAKHVWQCSYADGCSFEKFLELSQQPCFYCGVEKSNTFNKYINHNKQLTNIKVTQDWADAAYFQYNGLDRIDPCKGHDKDNVVPCCFPCNRAKDDRSVEEFREWLRRVSNYFLK